MITSLPSMDTILTAIANYASPMFNNNFSFVMMILGIVLAPIIIVFLSTALKGGFNGLLNWFDEYSQKKDK